MKAKAGLLEYSAFLAMTLFLHAGEVGADIVATVKEIIGNQRRILILREASGREERAEARKLPGRDFGAALRHVLMHVIHARSVEALPLLIGELKKRGFRFACWDGKKLVSDSPSAKIDGRQ